jgi:hypothetical protein
MEVVHVQLPPKGFDPVKEDGKPKLEAREVGIKFLFGYAGSGSMLFPNSRNGQPDDIFDAGKSNHSRHRTGRINEDHCSSYGFNRKLSPQLNPLLTSEDFRRIEGPYAHQNVSFELRPRIHQCLALRIIGIESAQESYAKLHCPWLSRSHRGCGPES